MDAGVHDGFAARVNKLLRATSGLHIARGLFQDAYDSWLAERADPALPVNFLHAIARGIDRVQNRLPTPLDPASDRDAVALALAGLGPDENVIGFFAAASATGLFDRPNMPLMMRSKARQSAMKQVIKTLDRGALEALLPEATLQTATADFQAHDQSAIWIDPGHLLPAILMGRRRLCKIMRRAMNGALTNLGTGFLVGPSAVMTNQHVVASIETDEVDPDELFCWFDFSETTGAKSDNTAKHFAQPIWEIASSPPGKKQPDGAKAGWWTDRDVLRGWLDEVRNDLDYAVIRLASTPGLQRGWYDLAKLDDASSAQHGIVLHHPVSQDQTMTLGKMEHSRPEHVRLFHQAATASGSSGGLLLNEFAQPIGLHHMGITYEEKQPSADDPERTITRKRFVNVAINLRHIRDDLKAKGRLDDLSKTSPITPAQGCIANSHPVFGRAQLLRDLQTMWEDNDKRILIVSGPKEGGPIKRPGKSFTIDIISSLFRRPEHHHIVFKAGATPALAREFAVRTIGSFAEDLVASVPGDEGATTTSAYVQTLVNFMGQKIAERLSNGTVWLMIDDLEHHDVVDSSGREFLATAYDQIQKIPNLRVVLIGLPRDITISGIDEKTLIRSQIEPADISDFHTLFKTWFQQRSALGTPMDPAAVDLFARSISSYAETSEPLEAMAGFVVKHMSKVADEVFGKAVLSPMGEDEV